MRGLNIHLKGRAVAKGESGAIAVVLGDFTPLTTHPLASTCAVAVVGVLGAAPFHSPLFPAPP